MDKNKYSTFRIVVCIFFLVQCIKSLDQSLFAPSVKNVVHSAQSFTDDDSGEIDNEIRSSTFVQSPSHFNTLKRDGNGRQFHNFHSQKTESRFHSTHQGKSSFKSESHFPLVQKVKSKQQLSNGQTVERFFRDDDEDEQKTIQMIAASLKKKSNTRAFQNGRNKQVNFLTKKTRRLQVPDSHQSRKEQNNLNMVKNVDEDNNFSFDFTGLKDEDLPSLFAPDYSDIQHFFREETLPTFRDQGKKVISNKDRNFLLTENSSFMKNAGNSEVYESSVSTEGDWYPIPADNSENKEIPKTYYFGKDEGTSGNPSPKRKVTIKSGYSIKMKGNWPGVAINTNSEGNLNKGSRGMIFQNIILGPRNKALSESSSKIGVKGTSSVGETISQNSLTGNGQTISIQNNNTPRKNLKNRWKSQAFNFGAKFDSTDSLKESELTNVALNSEINKGTESVLEKEILGFEPRSKSQRENKIFIHNINLGSKDYVAENKKSTFERGSVKRVESRVDDRSNGRGFGKMNHGQTETKYGTVGISSIRKTNFENRQITPTRKEIFTFEPVTKSSLTKEKNNIFFQNINLGPGNSPGRQKKRIFGSKSLKESGFIFDDNSSMDKKTEKLTKNAEPGSPNLIGQETNRSKEKAQLIPRINTVEAKANVFVHNINLGSKNENLENQGLNKNNAQEKSLNGVQMVEKLTENNFGQVGFENVRFLDANKTPTSVNQSNFDSVSINKIPSFLVRNIHLNSESSFIGSTSPINTNNKAFVHPTKKSHPVKITNTVIDITQTQPSGNVYIESIKLGSATSSMNRRDQQRNFNKGKNTNVSIEGKTIQLNKDAMKNEDSASVKKLTSGPLISTLRNAGSNLDSGHFDGGEKETFFSFGSSSESNSRKNKTNTFVHNINLNSKVSPTGAKNSVDVLESQKNVVSNEIYSNEKSNLGIFFKGTNQRRQKVGRGGEGGGRGGGERDLILDNPRITIHKVNFGSINRMAKRKETNRNSETILKNKSRSFAGETPGNDPTVKEFQSIFNWNALYNGKSMQRQIPSRKRIINSIPRNKPHFRYIFSGSDRLNPPNQIENGDSSVPMNSNDKDENKFVAANKPKEQDPFVAHINDTLIVTPTTTTSTTTIATDAPTTVTTHAPIRNITPLKNYTKYHSLPPNVCDKCRLVNGVGYREHPGDCQLYVQCYFWGSDIKSVTRDCGLGQFWDQSDLTCKRAHLVNCITDQCRIPNIRGYRNKYNCRAYWTCIGGKSYGKCCQPGHTYVEGTGCVEDNFCRDSCKVNQLSPGICPLKIVPGDDSVFQQKIAGHGWKVQKCAPGTFFNISTCSCSAFLKQQSILPTCKPEVQLTFDGNDDVMFGRQNGIKNENVTVQNGVAKFTGNSRLLLWRFANAYLGKRVFVEVKFREIGHSGHTEAILSNGDCDHNPSLYIAVNTKTKQLHMGAVTDFGTSDVKIAYNANGWKKVTYIFDGDHVTGSVNGMRKTGRKITGNIQSRQCTMQIGAGYGMHHFNGEIDEFSLYLCKPENI